MINNAVLSHEDTYKNLKTFERYEALEQSEVYVFGVMRGKHFTLIKKSDSFLSRIWSLFLKFLRVIKVDPLSIAKLKEYSIDHSKHREYRAWARDNGKICLEGRLNLLEANENLEQRLSEQQKILEEQQSVIKNLQKNLLNTHQETIDLTTHLNEMRSETASARADMEKSNLMLTEKNLEIDKLKAESNLKLCKLKEKTKKQATTIDKLKKENLYYLTGWKELCPDKTIRKYLKEVNLYAAIKSQFPSKKKPHKEKLAEVVA